MMPTQFEVIDDVTVEHMDASVYALETLSHKSPLNSQMMAFSGVGFSGKVDFIEEYFAYYHKEKNTYFVLSDQDIENYLLVEHIKENVEGVENNCSIGDVEDATSVNYSIRDKYLETNFNGKDIKVYIHPKSTPQDQQYVSYIVENNDKVKRKNKLKP